MQQQPPPPRWLPPIRNGILIMRQQQQEQQQQQRQKRPPPIDEMPLIQSFVEQIQNASMSSILDIPDIAFKIEKLKRYTFLRPLGVAIQENSHHKSTSKVTATTGSTIADLSQSSSSKNDIHMIQVFYKEIDWIVWTYELWRNQNASESSASLVRHELLTSLSYSEFVNRIFQSYFVPAVQYINDMHRSHDDEGASPILDLLLCRTDIPIPSSMYDLPKALYYALEQTKYVPSTHDDTDSSASTEVSLVYAHRNQNLQNNSNKLYYEVEDMRYNILYLYILAQVAMNITNAQPSGNNIHESPSTTTMRWKDTFMKIIECHPLSSAQHMMHLVPLVSAMMQLEWYCNHVTISQSSSTDKTVTMYTYDDTFQAYGHCPLTMSLKSIVSDLLKEE
jgi:hypothetical protein